MKQLHRTILSALILALALAPEAEAGIWSLISKAGKGAGKLADEAGELSTASRVVRDVDGKVLYTEALDLNKSFNGLAPSARAGHVFELPKTTENPRSFVSRTDDNQLLVYHEAAPDAPVLADGGALGQLLLRGTEAIGRQALQAGVREQRREEDEAIELYLDRRALLAQDPSGLAGSPCSINILDAAGTPWSVSAGEVEADRDAAPRSAWLVESQNGELIQLEDEESLQLAGFLLTRYQEPPTMLEQLKEIALMVAVSVLVIPLIPGIFFGYWKGAAFIYKGLWLFFTWPIRKLISRPIEPGRLA